MKTYLLVETLEANGLAFLQEKQFAPIVWGFVSTGDWRVLIAERKKKDDPKRKGQLVIPGGKLKQREDRYTAAVRETKEETGVPTCVRWKNKDRFAFGLNFHVFGRWDNVVYILSSDGQVWLYYEDTGKAYMGFVVDMEALSDKPAEQPGSDAVKPRFVPFGDLFSLSDQFTPVCQVLIHRVIGPVIQNRLLIPEANETVLDGSQQIGQYLSIGKPE